MLFYANLFILIIPIDTKKEKEMKKLVSGIQTSGALHIGNYIGSIKNWLNLQKDYDTYLFLADLHSITLPQNPNDLRRSSLEVAAAYIACGIDYKHSKIFIQSSVPAHTELSWILSCITSMGWMNRMTQFKDKSGDNKEKASLGLYSYPVLMAADILVYKADIVPVGEDQKQHLELTRDIAEAFNRYTDTNYFALPEPIIQKTAARIMSLKDGSKKMSKSDPSDLSRINLLDDQDTIAKKIKKATSDSEPKIFYNKENRPETSNLITIMSALSDLSIQAIEEKYIDKGFSAFKSDLIDITIEVISPISTKMHQLLNDEAFLLSILKEGSEKANQTASMHLKEIKSLFGFINF